jgi:hypothetical protein
MTHHDWCPFGTGERAGPCFGCECVEAAVAEEREACAAVADARASELVEVLCSEEATVASDVAAAIRARGEVTP